MLDYEEHYDDLDFYSIVSHGREEDDDMDAGDVGFMRGYLGMGEI